jgi:hypothetical protein
MAAWVHDCMDAWGNEKKVFGFSDESIEKQLLK